MRRTAALFFAAALALAGCGDDDDESVAQPESTPVSQESSASPSPQPSATPEPSPAAPTGTEITTASSEFGQMLFDADDQAIYLFDIETDGESECYDACAVAWPPVLTDGEPVASGKVQDALLGTTERTDGTTQVTYNDHPLYYYADEEPGEVKCHNVKGFGGLWLVVTPEGEAAD